MNLKRLLWFFASAVFVLMLVMTLLFTNVQWVAFDREYYSRQYERYQVPQSIGISSQELMEATDNLLNYIDGKRDNLDFQKNIKGAQQEFFSQRDKLHMVDVKNLFVQGKLIRNVAFWYCVIFMAFFFYKARDKRVRLAKLLITAFVVGIIPIILLGILMNIDFYKYFTIFHEIFFNNDLWQLEPANDRLINMFPEAFFSDTAFKIVYLYVGELILLLGLGILGRRNKRRDPYRKLR